MNTTEEQVRILAIERYLGGETPKAIYTSLGRSKYWFFKWPKRYAPKDPPWFRRRSKRPLRSPYRTPDEIEKRICQRRQSLDHQATFCGAQAILWQMEQDGTSSSPSESTVKRILRRHELIRKRTGRYQPKGRKYPGFPARRPNDLQQFDFGGPCYLQGPLRFYSLNVIDVASQRCALEAATSRQDVFLLVWNAWKRLGIPRFAQFDNSLEFYGSHKYPRNMGPVIRLCLAYGVQAVFIPIREPWRNGTIEKFNDHWNKMFYSRVRMETETELKSESQAFGTRHNLTWRYTRLGGQTPLAFLESRGTKLKFPWGPRPGKQTKPPKGRYHVMRFIRSDLKLDVFGEKFPMPAEVQYDYVRATINVGAKRLQVYRDDIQVAEFPYVSH